MFVFVFLFFQMPHSLDICSQSGARRKVSDTSSSIDPPDSCTRRKQPMQQDYPDGPTAKVKFASDAGNYIVPRICNYLTAFIIFYMFYGALLGSNLH